MRKANELRGKPLKVAVSIGNDYSKTIKLAMRALHKETMKNVAACFEAYATDAKYPKYGSLPTQLALVISRLLKKYLPIFTHLAKRETNKMIKRVDKNADATLKMSLKAISQDLAIKTNYTSPKMKDITKASVSEAVDLIKTIPNTYLSQVKKVSLHSISNSGKGFAELKPFLEKMYKGNERKAELVALDQTRKYYQNIQAEKMRRLGIKKFEWVHSHGGDVSRQEHLALDGKVFELDNPPKIGVMYGQDVYGYPGQLPNCRCTMIPVVDFGE